MPVPVASIQFFIKFMTASIVQFKSTLIFISSISGISIRTPFCMNNSYKLSDARERIVKTSVGFLSNASVPASMRDNSNNASSKCMSLFICRSISLILACILHAIEVCPCGVSAVRISPKCSFAIWTVKEIDVIGVLS